jgi:lysophospholipase L1-like esterase
MKYKKSIVTFYLLFLFALLVGFEYLLGVVYPRSPDPTITDRSIILKELTPGYQHILSHDNSITNLSVSDMKPVNLSVNKNGFIVGPNDTYTSKSPKIIFFGGSTTENIKADEDKRFPYAVSKYILEKNGSFVTTLNAGVSGNNTIHSVLNLFAKGISEDAKIAVLMNNTNDISGLSRTNSYWDAGYYRSVVQSKRGYGHYLLTPLRLYFPNFYYLLLDLRMELSNTKTLSEWASVDYIDIDNKEDMLRDFKRATETFVNISKIWGIEPVLMTQPKLHNTNRDDIRKEYNKTRAVLDYDDFIYMHDQFNDIVRRVALKEKILLIDLDKEFSWKGDYFYDWIHFNNQGNIEAAKFISDKLIEFHKPLFNTVNNSAL